MKENILSLKRLIQGSPKNNSLKIALLDEYIALKMWNEMESSLYTFLSEVPAEDPFHLQLKKYLAKRPKSPVIESVDNATYETDSGAEKAGYVTTEKISFDDVGGMEPIKKKIKQFIVNPFQNEELYKIYKKKIGGGILLYGPPGCGKTYLARAISQEIEASFLEVSLHEILDMWVGSSEKALHETFERARRNTPCVVFFDEVDALSFERSKVQQNSQNQIITQFLKEMDGLNSNNHKILTIGATNLPWNIDDAFRRPGRFDKMLFCPPPDLKAREKIFNVHLKDKPTMSDVDFMKLAKLTRDFSGADIMHVCDEAADECFEKAIEEERVVEISQSVLDRICKRHNPSTKDWFNTAQRYLDYANEDGLYDEIKDYLRNRN